MAYETWLRVHAERATQPMHKESLLGAAKEIEELRSLLTGAEELLSNVRGMPTECPEEKDAPCGSAWCANVDECMVGRAKRAQEVLTLGRPLTTGNRE